MFKRRNSSNFGKDIIFNEKKIFYYLFGSKKKECVGTTIDITHALRANSKARATHSTAYTLRGTLAYYGQHYVAFEKNPTTDLWTVFDDATVRVLGKPFDTVIATAARARLQPLLLFYERQQ